MFNNMKMSKKIILTGGFFIFLMFAISFIGQNSVSDINYSAAQMNQYESVYKNLKEIESEMYKWREPMINMFLGEELDLKKIGLDSTKSELSIFLKSNSMTVFLKKEPDFKKLVDDIKKPYDNLYVSAKKIVSAWQEGDVDTAIDTFKNSLKKSFDNTITELDKTAKFIEVKVEHFNKENSKVASNSKRNLIITFIVSTILMLGLGFLVIRDFNSKMDNLKLRVKDLAEGDADLTKTIDVQSSDEFGELAGYINGFIKIVMDLVVKIKGTTEEIKESTNEIDAGSDDLAVRTNEQAASITETSTTLEEFTSIVSLNSKNSDEVDTVLSNFNREIQQKKELIDNVTSTMEEIDSSSKKINSIITVINDISFQTNLLALNAAVEAARAGEAGRGFAVVASEVRNLAGKTADSSKTIQEIVNKNVESSKKGMELVNETSIFFQQILQVTADILEKVKSISDGSKEQTTGIEQINQAISQLDNVINKNATLVQDLSESSKNMKMNSITLFDLVNSFKIDNSKPILSEKPDKTKIEKTKKPSSVKKNEKKAKNDDDEDFFNADESGFEEF